MKKMVLIILGVVALVVAGYFCLNCGDSCSPETNNTNVKHEHSESGACGSCGKNSCDKSCSSSPGTDSTNFKKLIPSCSLSNEEMHERKKFLQETMAKKIARTEELETGYDLIFVEPIEYSKELLEFVNFERGCCSNFTFALIFEPNNKATHLQMYGSQEIKEELKNGFTELGFLK